MPCSNPSVAAGSSGAFTAVYSVNAGTASGTVITDTATVNATNQAFGPNSATATDVVATAGQADLALSTAAAPAVVLAGNNITYTQTVTNNGPGPASAVNFTEAIPANTTFVSVSAPAGWSCTRDGFGDLYGPEPGVRSDSRHHHSCECRACDRGCDDYREFHSLIDDQRSDVSEQQHDGCDECRHRM